jgi:hypothetical protein
MFANGAALESSAVPLDRSFQNSIIGRTERSALASNERPDDSR